MKICTNCNHILRDDETTCPYCAKPITEPPLEEDPRAGKLDEADTVDLVDEIDYATATLELPMGYLEDDAMVVSDTIDTASHEEYDFPPEQPSALEEEEEPSFDYVPDQPQEPEGDLELEARELEEEKEPEAANILGKLGVTLLALIIVALFIFGVSCLVKYMKGPVASDSELMLDYISGCWISEPFVFADDTSHSFVEEFTIYRDGSFTLRHLIPDARNENGYADGSWESDYQISGTVEVLLDSQCIIMKYTEFGKDYYFDRYMIETEDERLVLREFYDDAATQSYDIIYKRVAPAADAPEQAEYAQEHEAV